MSEIKSEYSINIPENNQDLTARTNDAVIARAQAGPPRRAVAFLT